MSIIKIKKRKNYTIISNDLINNESLTWEARGMLIYLLSKPEDWQVRVTDLTRQSPAGVKVVRRVIKELEEHGYISRVRFQDSVTKRFVWETDVREQPILPEGKHPSEKSPDRIVPSGQDILNTDLKRKEKEKPEEINPAAAAILFHFKNEITSLTPSLTKTVLGWIDDYPTDWITEAVDIAVRRGKRRPDYVEGILRRWKNSGKDSVRPVRQPGTASVEELRRAGYIVPDIKYPK